MNVMFIDSLRLINDGRIWRTLGGLSIRSAWCTVYSVGKLFLDVSWRFEGLSCQIADGVKKTLCNEFDGR